MEIIYKPLCKELLLTFSPEVGPSFWLKQTGLAFTSKFIVSPWMPNVRRPDLINIVLSL